MSDIKELLTELDFEQWLDTEGIIYRRGGVSARGREINIKECPVCGSSGWKVYFNLTNNVGKCFAGDHPEEIQFNKLVFLKHYSGKSRRAFEEYVMDEYERRLVKMSNEMPMLMQEAKSYALHTAEELLKPFRDRQHAVMSGWGSW